MISCRIKKLREGTGMSARKFAEEIGVKYTTYYGYEAGKREPGSDFIAMLANYFHVSTDYILGIEEENKKPAAGSDWLAKYNCLNAQDRALVDEMIERLYKSQSNDQ